MVTAFQSINKDFQLTIFCSILTAIVEICSVGAGLVKIAGVETEFFLTIDDSGVLRATVSKKETLFYEAAARDHANWRQVSHVTRTQK